MELWKPVKGYEGLYEVSNKGQVRSTERSVTQLSRAGVPYTRAMKSKLLAQVPGSTGRYLYVHLANVTKQHFSVHFLVLSAFVGYPQPGQEGCHCDGNSHNNALSNLRWDSHRSNELDKQTHGTLRKGDTHASSILTSEQVKRIKEDLSKYPGKKYGRYTELARIHGVDSKTIGALHRGDRWAHITP